MLGTFTLLMAYGAAVIPLAYACAFGFSSHSAAQVSCAFPAFPRPALSSVSAKCFFCPFRLTCQGREAQAGETAWSCI